MRSSCCLVQIKARNVPAMDLQIMRRDKRGYFVHTFVYVFEVIIFFWVANSNFSSSALSEWAKIVWCLKASFCLKFNFILVSHNSSNKSTPIVTTQAYEQYSDFRPQCLSFNSMLNDFILKGTFFVKQGYVFLRYNYLWHKKRDKFLLAMDNW